jgi:hypothetical protein
LKQKQAKGRTLQLEDDQEGGQNSGAWCCIPHEVMLFWEPYPCRDPVVLVLVAVKKLCFGPFMLP